jgi:interferon gamma-inducible protein 30
MTYICKAYKGKSKPEVCKSLSPKSESTEKANSIHPVCYVDEASNLTPLTAAEN